MSDCGCRAIEAKLFWYSRRNNQDGRTRAIIPVVITALFFTLNVDDQVIAGRPDVDPIDLTKKAIDDLAKGNSSLEELRRAATIEWQRIAPDSEPARDGKR